MTLLGLYFWVKWYDYMRVQGMNKFFAVGFLCVMASALYGTAQADDQKTAPAIVHSTCFMCHTERGNDPALQFVPRLAAQTETYIEGQLKAFRDGSRAGPAATIYMFPITQSLSDEQIKEAAAWYASQPLPAPFVSDALAEKGKSIYTNGVLSAQVPACSSCHGDKAAGNGIFPRLAGQNPQYLLAQLRYFRSGVRNDQGADIMKPIAQHLTDEQMEQVSHYISTL